MPFTMCAKYSTGTERMQQEKCRMNLRLEGEPEDMDDDNSYSKQASDGQKKVDSVILRVYYVNKKGNFHIQCHI